MHVWLFTLASVAAVSLASLVGLATLWVGKKRIRGVTWALVSFAVGGLLGGAFIHLIPEAFTNRQDSLMPSLLVLSGIGIFFVVEKLLRHVHGPLHPHPPLAAMNLIADGLHNFMDGMLIGASYLASPTLGLTTTVGVLLHELPQELGDFGVLLHAGLTVRRAVLLNLASASLAIIGAAVVVLAGASIGASVPRLLVPIAAGAFVYIATADLIPELQEDHTVHGLLVQGSLIACGIAVMGLLKVTA